MVGKPTNRTVAFLRISIPALIMNLGTSNTCVMSCLVPVIEKWSEEIGHHKAFFLMPLSYLLLIDGAFAIFSTSTNLIAQGLLKSHDLEPFEMFALAPIAVVCTLAALAYMIVVVPVVLSRFDSVQGNGKKEEQLFRKSRFDIRFQVPRAESDVEEELAGAGYWLAVSDKDLS